jgi:tRNA G18 (ribose-2'-O)-methylase SpoU
MNDSRNLIDDYKGWEVSKVKEELDRKAFPYSVLMQHIKGDFNISTFVRNGNAFGVDKLFYFGQRQWDRRGAVGTHNYKQLTHIKTQDELRDMARDYRFVALENAVKGAVSLIEFEPQVNDLYIFGEESLGICDEILALCEAFVYIPQFGSVRSLNVGTASGILMNHISQHFHTKGILDAQNRRPPT